MCEYCNHRNLVTLEEPEIPTQEAANYILEPARPVAEDGGSQTIIFCLDVSGSMCVSTAVTGRHDFKGDRRQDMQDLMRFSDGSDQHF